jgi:hypothetical protein
LYNQILYELTVFLNHNMILLKLCVVEILPQFLFKIIVFCLMISEWSIYNLNLDKTDVNWYTHDIDSMILWKEINNG